MPALGGVVAALARVRHLALDQPRQEDHVPLEPLRPVERHQLDGVLLDRAELVLVLIGLLE